MFFFVLLIAYAISIVILLTSEKVRKGGLIGAAFEFTGFNKRERFFLILHWFCILGFVVSAIRSF